MKKINFNKMEILILARDKKINELSDWCKAKKFSDHDQHFLYATVCNDFADRIRPLLTKPKRPDIHEVKDLAIQSSVFYKKLISQGLKPNVALSLTNIFVASSIKIGEDETNSELVTSKDDEEEDEGENPKSNIMTKNMPKGDLK